MEFGRFFGFLHPALVHFPLVLLLLSVALEALGFFQRDRRFTWTAQLLLALGTISMLFAFVAGNFAELWAAREGVLQDPMEQHELLATLTSWSFVFLTAARLYYGNTASRRWLAGYLVLAVAACLLLGVTGHRGAMLVYERGAGVQASAPPPIPTHEDLFQLTQKQDADAIFYSNKMHHLFGWMTLILSFMLMLDIVAPKLSERVWKIGPILLLIGGVYLMIFSDTDSWPLSHVRPVTDKEVLMHKTYATLMILIGLGGLRRRGETGSRRQAQGRTMGVFALIGGALLFTHVHSGAAYANVAVGVYVHHTIMGFVALAIGAAKLLEDALPVGSRWRRPGVWAYPALMGFEALLLINYNEGLPWFLGYGEMAVSTPHQGLLSHLGDGRAELTFDPATARFDLYTLHRNDDRPHPLAVTNAEAVVRVGQDSTLVPLTAVADAGGNTHFVGTASFLKGVPSFQTQVYFPRVSRAALVADFEPVVDKRYLLPHNVKFAYVCPMHAEIGANAPGVCSLCGMHLVPNKPPRPAGKLHDDGYTMDLATTPNPAPNVPIHLTLTPHRADGSVITELDVVHTKKLHLIIASDDLAFFDHVHPTPQPDGRLTLDYAFPRPGNYLLYADMTPTGDRNQVFRLPISVAGTPAPRQALSVTPTHAKLFGDYRIALTASPTPLQAKEETYLTFTFFENSVPVSDLEPFLGAGGHCIILSEDTQSYLHSHPNESAGTHFGPDVTFHTIFPHSGRYKVWGQFLHRGKVVTADFTLDVAH